MGPGKYLNLTLPFPTHYDNRNQLSLIPWALPLSASGTLLCSPGVRNLGILAILLLLNQREKCNRQICFIKKQEMCILINVSQFGKLRIGKSYKQLSVRHGEMESTTKRDFTHSKDVVFMWSVATFFPKGNQLTFERQIKLYNLLYLINNFLNNFI